MLDFNRAQGYCVSNVLTQGSKLNIDNKYPKETRKGLFWYLNLVAPWGWGDTG